MAGRNYMVVVEGLETLETFQDLSDRIRLDAVRAINRAAASTRTESQRRMLAQINFPASYLSPAGKRLFVSRQASGNKLEAAITARSRATSLARFVTGATTVNKPGVNVEVQPGKTRLMKKAFLIRLPAGSAGIETKSNFGLAVRLKAGDTLRRKKSVVKMANGLYLLYGPSVQQVFLDNSGEGVAEDVKDFALDKMADEFLRLVDL